MNVTDYSTPKDIESDMRKVVKQYTGRTYVFSCKMSHLVDKSKYYLIVAKGTNGYCVWHYDSLAKQLFWGQLDLTFPVAMDYVANTLNGRNI